MVDQNIAVYHSYSLHICLSQNIYNIAFQLYYGTEQREWIIIETFFVVEAFYISTSFKAVLSRAVVSFSERGMQISILTLFFEKK